MRGVVSRGGSLNSLNAF